jgi:hypothetical protein
MGRPTKVDNFAAARHPMLQPACWWLSPKNYGDQRHNPYAYQQAAILREHLDRLFRGRESIKENEENRCLRLYPIWLGSSTAVKL